MIAKLFRPTELSTRASIGLLLLRVVAGLAFVLHGWGKIQNPLHWMGEQATTPAFFQALAAISEFGGGIAWILGLLTPLASFGMACTMAVAIHLHAIVMKHPFVPQGPGPGSYELPLVYFALAVLLMIGGAGKFSLDQLVFGPKRNQNTNSPA